MYDYDQLGRLSKVVKYQRDNGRYQEESVTTISYDMYGNIIAITDPNGNVTATNGVTDPAWRHTIYYEYDVLGRNTAVIYPDETEDLCDNPRKRLEFNYANNSLTILDEKNNRTVEYYDIHGRAITEIIYHNGEEFITKHYYDGLGNEVITIDPKQKKVVKEFNELNLLYRMDLPTENFWENNQQVTVTPYQRFVYDKLGQKISEITSLPGGNEHEVIYALDELGRVIKTSTFYTEDGVKKQMVVETYYDANGNKVEEVDANNTFLPKEQQKSYHYVYSATGLLLKETDPAGNVTSYTYDASGNRLTMTDPRGNSQRYNGDFTVIYEYDDLNRLVKGKLPAAYGQTTKPEVTLKYDPRGNLIKRSESDGSKSVYTYNSRNWVTTVNLLGDSKNYTTEYMYDVVGNKIGVTDSKGNHTVMEYDDLNRLVKVVYPEQNEEKFEYDIYGNKTAHVDGRNNRTEYVYDCYKHLIQVRDAQDGITNYRYDRSGNMTQMVNALLHTTYYQYDELNHLLNEVDAQGHVTQYKYDLTGKLKSSVDARGTFSEYVYYPNNLLEKVTLTNGSVVQKVEYQYDEAGFLMWAKSGAVLTKYNIYDVILADNTTISEYRPDPFGRIWKLTQLIDDRSFTVEYSYDVMGRVTGVKSPIERWVNYQYNNLGELIKVPGYINEQPSYDAGGLITGLKAANGIITSWEYDKNGRLKELNYHNQTELLKGYVFTYDGANNIVTRNNDTFSYDSLNQLIFANMKGQFQNEPAKEEQKVGKTLADYSGQNQLEVLADKTQIIDLDYAAGSIGVDLLGAVTVTKVELTPVSSIHRVNEGNLTVYSSLDDVSYLKIENWEVFSKDSGELVILLKTPVTARFIKVKSSFDDRNKEFAAVNKAEFFNKAEEIIKVYYSVTAREEEYSYDLVGNRLTERVKQRFTDLRSYSYYPNSTQLLSDGKYRYTYDQNGNLSKKESILAGNDECWNYEYDLFNRLIRVSKNGKIVVNSYVYDNSGLRVKKDGMTEVYYVFGLEGELLYEEENGNYLGYVYILGKHFARVDGNIATQESKTYFYQTDHLGSTVLVADAKGNTVWSSEYAPFGKVTMKEGFLEKVAKYTGKDLDEDTGLYYFNARWYDQEIGRFISKDTYPIERGDSQSINLYLYTLNNPLRYIDPDGNFAKYSETNGSKPLWYYGSNLANKIMEEKVEKFTNTGDKYWESVNFKVQGGISFKEITQKYYNNEKAVAIKTVYQDGKFYQQEVNIYDGDTQKNTGNIPYEEDNQKNLVAVEGFFDRKDYGALAIVVNQNGIVDFFTRGSTLPKNAKKYATIRERTCRYISATHNLKGKVFNIGEKDWQNYQYPALRLSNMQG